MTKKINKEVETKNNRRTFITKGALGAVAAGVAVTGITPASASKKRVLKMVMTWPKKFPGLGVGAERLADRITFATNGRITIKVYGAGELVPAFESFDAVSNGTADVYHGAAYYWQGKTKAASFFAAVPFGMTATEFHAWLRWGGGQELWNKLYGRFNLKPFQAGNTGVQMGGWFRKEIKSINDLRGLKMRMPGLGGSVLNKVGGSAVSLPGGEIFQALQTGTIDATEWVGPYNDLPMGFYKVAPYYYYPGFHEPGTALEIVFNKDVWKSFSKQDQEIITAIIEAENATMLAEFNAKNSSALDILVNKHGVKLRQFSDEIYKELYKATQEVLQDFVESDKDAAKVYKSYSAFAESQRRWNRLADGGYTKLRDVVKEK